MSLRVVLAPDSFKESLPAADVCAALEQGVRAAARDAEVACVPMADGGEGTAATLVAATGGRHVPVTVAGPLGTSVESSFGLLGDGTTAVVELAAASGLELVAAGDRDVHRSGTFGTGELVRAALDAGATRVVVGIGGSATNDGGAGLLVALGARVLDGAGEPVRAGATGLHDVADVDWSGLDPRLRDVRLDVACDVDNPLLGPRGASTVFGPQKGASAEDVAHLEAALTRWADVVARSGEDRRDVAGAGAAGGTGLALLQLGADLRPGVELVAEVVGLRSALHGADLVITGEGRVDAQTLHGKTPAGVVSMARELAVPVVVLAGCVGDGAETVLDAGAAAVLPIADGATAPADLLAPDVTAANLQRTARSVVTLWLAAARASADG
ncbi:glycerate kinase [Aeromicrobium halocynthiae]|uniref:Glycerate kinase n=1 Tax=Aeromicrobium halocynthiae TaxID=560557 RepID=A0ABN2VYS5_9ACTN